MACIKNHRPTQHLTFQHQDPKANLAELQLYFVFAFISRFFETKVTKGTKSS